MSQQILDGFFNFRSNFFIQIVTLLLDIVNMSYHFERSSVLHTNKGFRGNCGCHMYCCMLQISRKTNVSCLRADGGEIVRRKEDTNEGQNKGQIPPICFSVAGPGKSQSCSNPANERLDRPHFALGATKV